MKTSNETGPVLNSPSDCLCWTNLCVWAHCGVFLLSLSLSVCGESTSYTKTTLWAHAAEGLVTVAPSSVTLSVSRLFIEFGCYCNCHFNSLQIQTNPWYYHYYHHYHKGWMFGMCDSVFTLSLDPKCRRCCVARPSAGSSQISTFI